MVVSGPIRPKDGGGCGEDFLGIEIRGNLPLQWAPTALHLAASRN